jgi:hypothetical protein
MSDVTVYLASDLHPSEHVVLQPDFDSLSFDLAALREELATAKRNEHNSEVAYKAAIEKQGELREDLAAIVNNRNELKHRLTAAEQRNADVNTEAAAKMLAACMDYPWEHMPENGRSLMRKHAKDVVDAALAKPTESGASE